MYINKVEVAMYTLCCVDTIYYVRRAYFHTRPYVKLILGTAYVNIVIGK